MSSRTALLTVTCAASLWLSASPASAFWCGGYLVLVGDRAHEVRARCGEPASLTTTTESTTEFVAGTAAYGRRGLVAGTAVTRTVAVEIWVYDFGRTRFMEELRFENGVLTQLTRLGRGTRRGSLELRTRPEPIGPRLALGPALARRSRV